MTDIRTIANNRFEQAVAIVRDGQSEAEAYAERSAREYRRLNPFQTPPGGWSSWKATVARNARACAAKIIEDGRPFYEIEDGGEKWLVICTLDADASAGPVGYDLWNRA